MLQIIREQTGQNEPCPYIQGYQARMRYRLIDHCRPETYESMLDRGWRRFGRVFFRPVCEACEACRSLRIDVERFKASRSMRRIKRRNQDLQVSLGPASLTEEHLELYSRYHLDMSTRRGWPEKSIAPEDYFQTFLEGREGFGHEMLYWQGDRLVAVALVDLLPGALSAVYCYYEPEQRSRSLGVYSVLRQIDLARSRAASRLYLGYWIPENESMAYKARYKPHEILEGRPEFEDNAIWRSS